jgi:hypothetical protein
MRTCCPSNSPARGPFPTEVPLPQHGHDIWAENVPVAWSWVAHVVFGVALAPFGWTRAKIGW